MSDIIVMLCGIPQETVLEPTLFIIFIIYLPGVLELFCQLRADACTKKVPVSLKSWRKHHNNFY